MFLSETISERNITLSNEWEQFEDESDKKETDKPFQTFYYLPEEDEVHRYATEKNRANALCRGETDPIVRKQY